MIRPAILHQLDELEVTVSLDDDRIRLRPASRVSHALAEEVRANKSDLLEYLRWRTCNGKQGVAGPQELQDLERRVQSEGYVLLWSTLLEDTLALYRSAGDLPNIPPGFVPYSMEELGKLFGDDESAPSVSALRRFHLAKKMGAVVTDARDEHDERR